MLKKIILLTIFTLFSFYCLAQNTIKIGVIDPERILRESVQVQKVYKDLKALYDKKADELKKKQDEITQLEEKYKAQAPVLSPEARAELEEKIKKAYLDIDKFKEESKIELQTKENAALNEMEKKVAPIIQSIGQKENYTLILRKEMVVYMNEVVDITDKVIKILNETETAAKKQ